MNGKIINFLYDKITRAYGVVNYHYVKLLGRLPFVPSLPPMVLRLRTSVRCNLKCSFCYQSDSLNQKETGHLEIGEWRRILGEIPRQTIIDVTGGETFVSKNFMQIMELILKKKMRCSLITNGSFPDQDKLKVLVESGLYFFMVSVDGLKEYHNKVRGNANSFDNICKTLDIINNLKKEKGLTHPKICLKTTITNDNYNEIPKVIEFFNENYQVEDFTLNLMFQNKVRGGNIVHRDFSHADFVEGNTEKYDKDEIHKIVEQIDRTFEYCEDNELSVKIKPDIKNGDYEGYLKKPSAYGVSNCSKSSSVLTMYYDGSITPCDIGLNVVNVRDLNYDLKKAWKLQSIRQTQKELKKGFHPSCEGCCLMQHQLRPQGI